MNDNARFAVKTELLQFLYSLFIIILIPAALVLNTAYILKSVQRDVDFELNNKALLVESVIAFESKDKLNDNNSLKNDLSALITKLPEIKAIEIFRLQQDEIQPIVTTSTMTRSVSDPALNQLAWGTNQAYSKQIFATIGTSTSERVWLVASPLTDSTGKKVGLINLYISAAQIDAITKRTIKDSLAILIGTVVVILLLLLNHFKFFQQSILFKKLSDLDKLKNDFISMASHELRSPLTIIVDYASVLMTNPIVNTDAEVKKEVRIIAEAGYRLSALVEDLLDVSRIEQNKVALQLVECDIRDIMQEVVDDYQLEVEKKGLKLNYTKYPEKITINCDRNKMKQIFINLVSNAVKYTPSGAIQIYHEIDGGNAKTYVKDTGVGISSENKEKLFGKFNRIYNDKTKEVKGSGLGLWITKQLVEKMMGKIYCDSIKDQGTQFSVIFPLSVAKKT